MASVSAERAAISALVAIRVASVSARSLLLRHGSCSGPRTRTMICKLNRVTLRSSADVHYGGYVSLRIDSCTLVDARLVRINLSLTYNCPCSDLIWLLTASAIVIGSSDLHVHGSCVRVPRGARPTGIQFAGTFNFPRVEHDLRSRAADAHRCNAQYQGCGKPSGLLNPIFF